MRSDSQSLSSWKEIAAYLGKSIRTVERWQQEFGLPVRRPIPKGIVYALRNELDEWLSRMDTRPIPKNSAEVELRQLVSLLQAEVERLRLENDRLRKATGRNKANVSGLSKSRRTP